MVVGCWFELESDRCGRGGKGREPPCRPSWALFHLPPSFFQILNSTRGMGGGGGGRYSEVSACAVVRGSRLGKGPRSKSDGVAGAWQRQGHQRRAPTVNVAKWGPVFSTRQDMWPNEAQFSVAGKHMSAHRCEKSINGAQSLAKASELPCAVWCAAWYGPVGSDLGSGWSSDCALPCFATNFE